MSTDITLNNVIIRYPHLDVPWSGRPTIEADYQCQLILPKGFAQWSELQACAAEAARLKGLEKEPDLKYPWLDRRLQPRRQEDGPYAGEYFISAKGKGTKPGVVGPDNKVIPDMQIKNLIFSGCIVNAWVNFYGYKVDEPGIALALRGIQLVNNQVERIADKGQDPTQVFQPVPGAPAPTAPVPGGPQNNPPW